MAESEDKQRGRETTIIDEQIMSCFLNGSEAIIIAGISADIPPTVCVTHFFITDTPLSSYQPLYPHRKSLNRQPCHIEHPEIPDIQEIPNAILDLFSTQAFGKHHISIVSVKVWIKVLPHNQVGRRANAFLDGWTCKLCRLTCGKSKKFAVSDIRKRII